MNLLRTLTLSQIRTARSPVDPGAIDTARAIIADIERSGESALRAHAERLGDIPRGAPLIHTREDLASALTRIPGADRDLLERTADRIRSFARAQRGSIQDMAIPIPGGSAGHTFLPVDSAGCYAPGGRFPLPSSVLMTVIPARVAGVSTVWAASPKPPDITLAAAAIAGADGLLAVGGPQAIAAMTFGIAVPRCDMIVGPGNRFVTAAKFLVSDRVGIDMLAGPSELVVLADESAHPDLIAADLLAQAEHDPDAIPILVTTSPDLAHAVDVALERRLAELPTRAIAIQSLTNGGVILTASLDDAVAACNELAPEHLEVMTRDAASLAPHLRHCGGLFIGAHAAEVLGDYGAGPNHVLPTGRSARHRAGLSVLNFLRARTWMTIDNPSGAADLTRDAALLADLEHLAAHAASAKAR